MSKTLKSIIKSFYSEDQFKDYFSGIYPFTTENIAGYIDLFDLNNKSLLTVGSSGDQPINAISRGCNRVTVLDVNPYTRYYYYLKIAAIISLEIDEYLRYLRLIKYNGKKENKDSFNKETYLKLRDVLNQLDEESFSFWDKLYKCKRPLSIRRELFSKDENNTETIIAYNPYLQSEEEYLKTRSNIQIIRPTFLTKNIITDVINGQFDNIWLSNIGVYIDLETLRKLVIKVNELLNKQGDLLISYLYDFTKDTKYHRGWDPIYDLKSTFRFLEEFNPQIKSFTSLNAQDSVLIQHK